jgi:excisionase family DNA binding protein
MFDPAGRKAAISVSEFCAAIGCGRSTFYVQLGLGNIRVVKLGTRTLVPAEEVEAFLKILAEGPK